MTTLTYAIIGGITVFAALVALGAGWHIARPRPHIDDPDDEHRTRQRLTFIEEHRVRDPRPPT